MYIFILWIVFVVITICFLYNIFLIDSLVFSEKKRAVLYRVQSALKNRKRYHQFFYYSIIVSTVVFVIIFIYPIGFLTFVIPVSLLIVFDYCFLTILIHFLKKYIFDLHIQVEYINKTFFFNNKKIIISNRVWHEGFVFVLPDIFEKSNKIKVEQSMLDLKNFIWILRLYMQGEIKYYAYVLGIVMVETAFFILIYYFYFIGLLDIKNGFFVFIFLLIWLVYVIVRLKSLLGLNYFMYLFSDYQKQIELRPVMKYLSIYRLEHKTNRLLPYKLSEILQNVADIKNTIIKNVDYFIGFVSTVLFVALLTFVLSFK